MGREIRRVPADWEHPRYTPENAYQGNQRLVGKYIPKYDEEYTEASKQWIADCIAWSLGIYVDQWGSKQSDDPFFWEYHGNPPDSETYRDRAWTEEEATHYQMYETVSEGTPVTPVFATLQELEDWLVEKGEYYGIPGLEEYVRTYSRESAKAFCADGDAPSMVVMNEQIMSGVEACAEFAKDR